MKYLLFPLFLTIFAITSCGRPSDPESLQSAENWLVWIDSGEYDRSWKESSELFRKAVSAEKWRSSLEGVRTPLGAVLSRKRTTARMLKSLPGAPDADYCVMIFSSSFERKKKAVETVTFVRDADLWKAAGYYIR